jgi:hypothetical protein
MEGFLKAMQSTFCPVGFLSYNRNRIVGKTPSLDEHPNEHFSVKKVE